MKFLQFLPVPQMPLPESKNLTTIAVTNLSMRLQSILTWRDVKSSFEWPQSKFLMELLVSFMNAYLFIGVFVINCYQNVDEILIYRVRCLSLLENVNASI